MSEQEEFKGSGNGVSEVKPYRIGTCLRTAQIDWQFCENFADSQKSFKQASKSSSAVLFDEQRQLPLLFSSIHPVDVACILRAYKESISQKRRPDFTTVDRTLLEKAVASGDAPFVPPSRSLLQQWLLKRTMDILFWRESVNFFSAGPHRYASLCYLSVHQYPQVRGHVALTLDDAPCRFSRENSRLSEVLDTLQSYEATATFMMVGKFMEETSHQQDLIRIFQEGHEMGNHGMMDRAYDDDSTDDFARAVDDCSSRIEEIQRKAGVHEQVRYFRAPHGKYTRSMEEVIHSRGLINVMCDTYASCPIVEDGDYIGSSLAKKANDGSIILLHMPEKGFRDWCIVALRRFLACLQQRGLKAVSVSRLRQLAGCIE